nr:MAG TPA: hypothetical protein [Caudoviricetes sp.]
MIMESKKNDCKVGTPKWDVMKWFCGLVEKNAKLKKEKLRTLKKDRESTTKIQDERNLYPRGGNNMWTYKEDTIPVKREIEFITLTSRYLCDSGDISYRIYINEIIPVPTKCDCEMYVIPPCDIYSSILDNIAGKIDYDDTLRIFMNIKKRKGAVSKGSDTIELSEDKYFGLLKYLNENVFTSWIFDTPLITKQLEEKNDSKE